MAFVCLNYPLKRLVWLQKQLQPSFIQNQIHDLILELRFVRTFLRFTAKRGVDDQKCKDLSARIEVLMRKAGQDLQPLCPKCSMPKFDSVISGILLKAKLLRSEIREIYAALSCLESSTSSTSSILEDDCLVKFLDSLIENLKDLSDSKFNVKVKAPVDQMIIEVEVKLRSMRNLLRYVVRRSVKQENLEDLVMHAEAVADQAAFLSYFCFVDQMDRDMASVMGEKLSDLLPKITLCDPGVRELFHGVLEDSESSQGQISLEEEILIGFIEAVQENLKELLKINADSVDSLKDNIEILQPELSFMRIFLLHPPKLSNDFDELADDIMTDIETAIGQAWKFTFLLFDNKEEEEMFEDTLENMQRIKETIREKYVKDPEEQEHEDGDDDDANDAAASADDDDDDDDDDTDDDKEEEEEEENLSFLDSLSEDLNKLLNSNAELIPLRHLTEIDEGDFRLLIKFFKFSSEEIEEDKELKDYRSRVTKVLHRAKGMVDSFHCHPAWYLFLQLMDVKNDVRSLKDEIIDLCGEEIENFGERSAQATSPTSDMVGFKQEIRKIRKQLASGGEELKVISIFGMPGLGKTTLARRVFDDVEVINKFDTRSWCVVSQNCTKKDLFLKILNGLKDPSDTANHSIKTAGELADQLRRFLLRKRSLIVLDDVWEAEVGILLYQPLKTAKIGSRVMLTSRYNKVADGFRFSGYKYQLRYLDQNESWELLEKKIFGVDKCPSELEDVGRVIARNCHGVPLALVLIAGVLSKKKENVTAEWNKVAEDSSSYIAEEARQSSKTVEEVNRRFEMVKLSYEHLPDPLKPCFLYFGAFPEDHEMRVSKLTWLWMAEGFVEGAEDHSKSLEDIAEDYLNDLVSRNLVMVTKERSQAYQDGVQRPKTCTIHDFLRDWCIEKAKQENFLLLIDGYDKLCESFSCLASGVDLNNSSSSNPISIKQRRLCICSSRSHLTKASNFQEQKWPVDDPRVCTLFFFATWPFDYSFNFGSFNHIKVVDLVNLVLGDSFPNGLETLIQLTFLAARVKMKDVPSSIGKLCNLETLILKGLRGEVNLPDVIWSMSKLRHMHINASCSFPPRNDREVHLVRDNLKTLSTPTLRHGDDMMKGFRALQKLRCIFVGAPSYSRKLRNYIQFPVLDFLTELESLKVLCHSVNVPDPCQIEFPKNLKKLTLSHFRLPWSKMETISSLQNLEILKLLFKAFEGEKWEMEPAGFVNLKILKLENLDIREWLASSEKCFPAIERLVLKGCKNLKEIPSCLEYSQNIKRIEVQWCNSSAAKKVRKIQDARLNSFRKLEVVIYPSKS